MNQRGSFNSPLAWSIILLWLKDDDILAVAGTSKAFTLLVCEYYEQVAIAVTFSTRISHVLSHGSCCLRNVQTVVLCTSRDAMQFCHALLDDKLRLPSLQQLVCNRIALGSIGAAMLSRSLCHLPRLMSLQMAKNALQAEGTQELSSNLHHVPYLQELNLSFNQIDSISAGLLSSQFIHLQHLRTLDLELNRLKNSGMAHLSSNLKYLPSLIYLNVSMNGLHAKGISFLSAALVHVPLLQQLHLNCNDFGDEEGCRHLAEGMKFVGKLRVLSLGMCSIDEEGMTVLIPALGEVPELERLNLVGNRIGNNGLAMLMHCMQRLHVLRRLKKLELKGNQIGGESMARLKQMLLELGIR